MYTTNGRHPAVRPAAGSTILRAVIVALLAALVMLPAPTSATPVPPQALTPAYMWHTFYGSDNNDGAQKPALDDDGNLYAVGLSAASWNGPAGQAPLHAHSGGADITVVKLDRNGAYLWHTFYGSSGSDHGRDIVVDANGDVLLTAQSNAAWLGDGNTAPLHGYSGDWDAVIVKLDSDGSYQWHTFYGSSGAAEYGYAITTDGNQDVRAVVSSEGTWDGPTGQAPLHAFMVGGNNMAALALDDTGNYQWHTFYRGYTGLGVATDDSDNVYLAALCDVDWNGPTGQAPLHARNSSIWSDHVIVKLATDGNYVWHTFYGSDLREWSYDIAVAGSDIYVMGHSESSWNGPAAEPPLHAYTGGIDLLVLNLDTSGAYQWHTFYGASGDDSGYGVDVDTDGNIFVSGTSPASWNGPSSELPLHAYTGGLDIAGLKLAADGSYRWHTFYGSAVDDWGYGVVVDSRGSGYLAGTSAATWQGDGNTDPLHAHSGGMDAVVVKLATYRLNLPVVLRQYP